MKYTINYITLGGIGYMPASGTVATLVTLPLVYLMSGTVFYIPLLLVLCVSALVLINRYIKQKNVLDDPPEIVIDEVIGCLITFYGIPCEGMPMVYGFGLFRILDIFKLGGTSYLEKLPGAWGIILDDVWAGVLSNIIIRFFLL